MSSSRRADYKKSGPGVRKPIARAPVGSQSQARRVSASIAVPGVTRTGGAYARALMSRYGQEGKYLDMKIHVGANINGFSQDGRLLQYQTLGGVDMSTMCQVAQGTSANQRIGNKIRPYQIRMRGYLNFHSNHPCFCRVLLVEDRQANGALPSLSDMLVAGTDNHYVNAFYNMDNIARFRFLKDKIVKFDNMASQILSGDDVVSKVYIQPFKMSHKIKGGSMMEYSSNTGAIAEIRSVNYFIVVISSESSNTDAAQKPTITGHVRFYFKE